MKTKTRTITKTRTKTKTITKAKMRTKSKTSTITKTKTKKNDNKKWHYVPKVISGVPNIPTVPTSLLNMHNVAKYVKCTKVIAFSETQMVESLSLGAALARSFTLSVCKYHCLVTWTLDNAPEYIVYNQTCDVSDQSLFSLPTCMPAFSGPRCT